MKAIRIHTYGDVNTLQLEEAPTLAIESDQLLVRIRDAGVNPIDWKIREGYLKSRMPANFPLTMGQDFAGEVVEQGKDVQSFNIGDRVFGFAQGTYAEYAAAPASTVSTIPSSLTFEVAAALPTAGSTALQIILRCRESAKWHDDSHSWRGGWRGLICHSGRQAPWRSSGRYRHGRG